MPFTRLFLLLLFTCSTVQAREWTTTNGQKIDAEFVSLNGNRVTLKRDADGRTLVLLLSRLSEADQAWIKSPGDRTSPSSSTAGKTGSVPQQKPWFTCDFEKPDWETGWNMGNPNLPRNLAVVSESSAYPIPFNSGKALEVTLKQGTHYGADFGYDFAAQIGSEPEEAVLSYKMCFAPDFNAEAVQGGKLPGFGGMYGDAGSAGKKVNGTDSWSARGAYWKPDANGGIPIGFYIYHADMKGDYGDSVYFPEALPRGKWHDIRLAIKLNTPATQPGDKGRNDGILRGWVNGQLAFDRRDIRFRDIDKLKIRNAWFHYYHGGGQPASADYKLWIDDVAISPGPIP